METQKYFGFFGDCFEIELTAEQINLASHQGDCEQDAQTVVKQLNGLNIPRQAMIDGLLEYGAWGQDELAEKSDFDLETVIVWVVAGDIKDNISETLVSE